MSERSLVEQNVEDSEWYDTPVPEGVAMFMMRSDGIVDSFKEVLVIATI